MRANIEETSLNCNLNVSAGQASSKKIHTVSPGASEQLASTAPDIRLKMSVLQIAEREMRSRDGKPLHTGRLNLGIYPSAEARQSPAIQSQARNFFRKLHFTFYQNDPVDIKKLERVGSKPWTPGKRQTTNSSSAMGASLRADNQGESFNVEK